MSIRLGNRLAGLRKKHGFSQEQLADELGISRQAVSRWENGESTPDTENIIALAGIYNISVDELIRAAKEDEEAEVVESEVVDPAYQVEKEESKNWVFSAMFLFASAAYLIVGFLWRTPEGGAVGWASMWILFLVPILARSIAKAIKKRRLAEFNMAVLVTMVFCGMGIIGSFYGQNFWHPYWVMWFAVPIFYSIAPHIHGKRTN